jgi:hypothetical protein
MSKPMDRRVAPAVALALAEAAMAAGMAQTPKTSAVLRADFEKRGLL